MATVAHAAVAILLVVIVVLLPLGVLSVINDVADGSATTYRLDRGPATEAVRGDLHLQVVGLNEWDGTASVRVSASQTCGRRCPWGDRYLFISALADADGARPSSEALELTSTTRDVVKMLRLPIAGDPVRYPFDDYRLALGIEVERIDADGSVRTLTPAEAARYTDITLQGRVPRGTMSAPTRVARLLPTNEDDQLAITAELRFGRPLYLKLLTLLLVLLVTAAAAYAVFMRPLDQLVINSGALVLGVWGVRSILLGSSVPGLTLVDISLVVVILFLLVAITVRTLWLLEERSTVKLLRRRGNTPAQ